MRNGSGDGMDPYTRLLGDAMKGDAWLSARGDGAEAPRSANATIVSYWITSLGVVPCILFEELGTAKGVHCQPGIDTVLGFRHGGSWSLGSRTAHRDRDSGLSWCTISWPAICANLTVRPHVDSSMVLHGPETTVLDDKGQSATLGPCRRLHGNR